MKSLSWPGIAVTLRVDGKDLSEYNEPDDDDDDQNTGDTIVRFVKAITDKNFSVGLTIDRTFRHKLDHLCILVLLDGREACRRLYTPKPGVSRAMHSIDGVSIRLDGQWAVQRSTFGALETTDESNGTVGTHNLANLGEVTCQLIRCEIDNASESTEQPSFDPAVSSKVPEKALKGRALSNYAELSAPTAFPRHKLLANVEYPWGHEPFLTFTFKYRSHRDLQIEGVIPRDLEDIPLEERDVDSLTGDEAIELLRRQRVRDKHLHSNVVVKREKRDGCVVIDDDDDADEDDHHHESASRKRQKTSQDSGVEIIDLTDG